MAVPATARRIPIVFRRRAALALLAIVLMALHVALASTALQGRILNIDEVEMTYSVLDRFAGVPPMTLVKPGGPMHLGGVPLVLGAFVLSGETKDASGFLDFLSHQYLTPWRIVFLLRLFVLLTGGLGVVALGWAIAERYGDGGAWAALAMLFTWPIVAEHIHMAVPDAMALGFAALSVASSIRLKGQGRGVFVIGLCFGLAVASRLTVIMLLPWMMALCMQGRQDGFRTGALWVCGLATGVLLFCPFLWMDPLRFAKAVMGFASRPGEPMGFAGAGRALADVVPLWTVAVAGWSWIRAILDRRWYYAGSIAIVMAWMWMSVANSAVFHPRYLLPLPLMVLWLMVEEWGRIGAALRSMEPVRLRRGLGTAGATLVILALALNLGQARRSLRTPDWNVDARAAAVELAAMPERASVLMPGELLTYVAGRCSPLSYQRLVENSRKALIASQALRTFAAERSLSADVIGAVPFAFNEREQAWVARLTIMGRRAPVDGLDAFLWYPDDLAARFGFQSESSCADAVGQGQFDVVITRRPLEGPLPFKTVGSTYYLYRR